MRKILCLLIYIFPLSLFAQFTESRSIDIRALQMQLNDQWDAVPVLTLGSDDEICFSFDEMSHTYHSSQVFSPPSSRGKSMRYSLGGVGRLERLTLISHPSPHALYCHWPAS